MSRYHKCTKSFLGYVAGKEVKFEVPWGYMAGKWYGNLDGKPVVTLHDFGDNCGIMQRFIADLNRQDVSFLCIDLPGHGLSSKLPKNVYYDWRNYALALHDVFRKFGKISILGHSSGGMVGYVYGQMFPQSLNNLIWLTTKPHKPLNNTKTYTYNQLKEYYTKSGLRKDLVTYILERNITRLKRSSDKFYLHTDHRISYLNPQLTGPSKIPVLTVGPRKIYNFEFREINATHYDLLNNPQIYTNCIDDYLKEIL